MRQIRDLGFGALLYRPAAIRALCEADAKTADGSGVFPSLTLRQGPAALAPLCGYPPACHRRGTHRVISSIIVITLLYYIWFSRDSENCSRFNDNSYDNTEHPRQSAAFGKERMFSRISDIICDNVNNT